MTNTTGLVRKSRGRNAWGEENGLKKWTAGQGTARYDGQHIRRCRQRSSARAVTAASAHYEGPRRPEEYGNHGHGLPQKRLRHPRSPDATMGAKESIAGRSGSNEDGKERRRSMKPASNNPRCTAKSEMRSPPEGSAKSSINVVSWRDSERWMESRAKLVKTRVVRGQGM